MSNTEEHKDESGEYHRIDGPAVIYSNGEQYWFYHGKLHRVNGPAVIWADGTEDWWYHDDPITRHVKQWCKERTLDIYNLSDEDKLALSFAMKGF